MPYNSISALTRIKAAVPWQIKILAKLVLSRIPAGYSFWHKTGLFVHGAMDRPEYLLGVVRNHFERAGWPAALKPGFVALELGPGDSVASAMIMRAFGVLRTFLMDTGDYATHDMEIYRKQAVFLREKGIAEVSFPIETEFGAFLRGINAEYLTKGLDSFREIPNRSIDFIWSQAVLEHIRRGEFDAMMAEFRRILAPGGICSHRVDLSDHLGGALNNLRFSRRVWESNFMASSGFYTNRIRYSEMLEIFRRNSFSVQVLQKDTWPALPTARASMDVEFKSASEDDLQVRGFDILLS